MMMTRRIMVWGLLVLMVSCQTKNVSEAQKFEASIRKELPFHIDSMRWVNGTDITTFQFANQDYVSTPPDAEINSNGVLSVYRTFIFEKPTSQSEDHIWRNIIVSKKNRRVICIDRYLREGKTHGFVYVMQSESKKYPTFGNYHWDVSDSHNIESVGIALNHFRDIAVKQLKGNAK